MARLPGKEGIEKSRDFNRAVFRLLNGKERGGILSELEIITGISRECLRKHAQRGEYDTDEDGPDSGLTDGDRSYLGSRYGKTTDPAIQEFLQSINTSPRKNPDYGNEPRCRNRPFSDN